jgi:ABC-type nitrate/sulfonate/bicarbonate transport system substrate-binding protein
VPFFRGAINPGRIQGLQSNWSQTGGGQVRTASFTRRSWATANSSTLEQYIAALVESLRWTLDAKNRAEATAILIDKFKLPKNIAERTYDLMSDPVFGFAPDAKFKMDGFKNVLALRAEIEGRMPAAPDRYVDLNYYERAMKLPK